jgi:hypothetical protein
LGLRRRNWTSRGGFFLRKFRHSQFHCALNRNSDGIFLLVDPAVCGERLRVGFARGLKFFFARFGAFLLVSVAARRRPDNREHHDAEKRKK